MITKIVSKGESAYMARLMILGRRTSKTFRRKMDAEVWERKMLDAKDRYRSTGRRIKEDLTVRQFSEKWWKDKVSIHLSPSTQQNYLSDLNRHILPLFGNLKLREVQLDDANRLIAKLKAQQLAPKTINGVLTTFKGMLFDAVRWELLDRNPLQLATPLKADPIHETYWTDSEIEQFLSAIQEDPWRDLYIVALNTGLRRGEICALKWDRVSFPEIAVGDYPHDR